MRHTCLARRLRVRRCRLVLCCPATPETEGLLDARRLALLPREAVLVNVGRGSLIEEEALYEADGYHPSAEGSAAVGEAVAQRVRDAFGL